MSKTMNNILRKSVVIFIIIFGTGCFVYQNYLNGYYLANAPKSPNYDSGETVETNEHGVVYYLTEQNKMIYILLLPLGGGLLMLSAFVAKVWKSAP